MVVSVAWFPVGRSERNNSFSRNKIIPVISLSLVLWTAVILLAGAMTGQNVSADLPAVNQDRDANANPEIQNTSAQEMHWSFVPPKRLPLPRTADLAWMQNAIDAFVLARLEAAGFTVSQQANLRTLLRRLSLDVTGLPPAWSQVQGVLREARPDSYQRFVDRVLASPHYGERMALDWLDMARYADTHGYSIDAGRTMWPWRDWVVNAYNENLRFDQFTIQQLAGDLLPNATQGQWVATGFNRNHMINFEGGAIPEEYRVEYVVDRVNTTATVWMGLTVGCARCHDHKYDPITQQEYYRIFAFFNTIRDMGLDGAQDNAQPMIRVPNGSERARLRWFDEQILAVESQLNASHSDWDVEQRHWEKQVLQKIRGAIQETEDREIELGEWYSLGPFTEQPHYRLLRRDFGLEGEPVNVDAEIRFNDHRRWQVHRWRERVDWSDGQLYDLPGDAAATYLYRNINVQQEEEVVLLVNSAFGWKIFLNQSEVFQVQDYREPSPDQYRIPLKLQRGDNELVCKVINYGGLYRFGAAIRPTETCRVMPPLSLQDVIRLPPAERTMDQVQNLRCFFRASAAVHPGLRNLLYQRAAIHEERFKFVSTIATAMVMRESTIPPDSFLLERGDYQQPAGRVEPGVPSSLPSMPVDASMDRLGFAQWLTAPEHPLTARVAVNRFWQILFGSGIVKTAADFGLQGDLPTHPALLDWLATEFVRNEWDMKRLIRILVTSATYQQVSRATPEALRRDPDNRYLARGPRFRLQAELIRDGALAVSGLLNDRMGGASVKPYQPDGLWSEISFSPDSTRFSAQLYQSDAGADVYRRGLYTFWKRSSPPPNMAALDAPNREVCTVSRPRTNTPLQALVLLNDPTFVEAARGLAGRMLREGGRSPEQQVQFGFSLATARQATNAERAVLLNEYERQRKSFREDEAAAEEMLKIGQSSSDTKLDVVEHAAWTSVAAIILNLDETLTKN